MTQEIPEQWAEQGWYDLETARAMLRSERFLYVPFCCQQAIEKFLKGVIAKTTGEMPPRIHNLIQLAEKAGLKPDAQQLSLMRELSDYYVQSRYPEEVQMPGAAAWQEIGSGMIRRTENLVQWLSTMI